MAEDSTAVLIYQDEMEIYLHQTLSWMWARLGRQPAVTASGKNEKQIVYGGAE
ncbi:MAG: hypothetical protein SH868_17805 [Bythopirellula sp.]|nr:hypothetical protein [Bythopirellula sp.]